MTQPNINMDALKEVAGLNVTEFTVNGFTVTVAHQEQDQPYVNKAVRKATTWFGMIEDPQELRLAVRNMLTALGVKGKIVTVH